MLSRCFLDFSVGVRASVIGLSQISSFSLKLKLTCIMSRKSICEIPSQYLESQ